MPTATIPTVLTGSRSLPMHRTRRTLLATLMIAAATAMGHALAGVPNVELVTLIVFVAGYLLGPGLGMIVGAGTAVFHSVFNPLGAALPPLLVAQALGFAVVGAAGGTVGVVIARMRNGAVAVALAGVSGFVLTFLYDVVTNIGAFFTITGEGAPEGAPENLFKFVAAGIVFTMMHLVWNTSIFLITVAPTVRVLARFRRELS